jgi:hypothetical protein
VGKDCPCGMVHLTRDIPEADILPQGLHLPAKPVAKPPPKGAARPRAKPSGKVAARPTAKPAASPFYCPLVEQVQLSKIKSEKVAHGAHSAID